MLTESQILTALRDCFDPEVKLNLVDLGLIYSIATGPDPDSTPKWPRQWVKDSTNAHGPCGRSPCSSWRQPSTWSDSHGAEDGYLGMGLVYYALTYVRRAKIAVTP